MCIDIVETWFGNANGQISSVFDIVICLQQILNLVSGQLQISSVFDIVICPQQIRNLVSGQFLE